MEKAHTKEMGKLTFGKGKSWKLRRDKKRQLKKVEKKNFQKAEEQHSEKECIKKVKAINFKNVVKEHFKTLEKHSKVAEKEQVKEVSMYRGRGRPRTTDEKSKGKDEDLEILKESKSQSSRCLGDSEMMKGVNKVKEGPKNDQAVCGEKNLNVGLQRRITRARSCKRIVNLRPPDQNICNGKEAIDEKIAPLGKRKHDSQEAGGLSCGSTLSPPCLLCPVCHKVLTTPALLTKHIGTEHSSCW